MAQPTTPEITDLEHTYLASLDTVRMTLEVITEALAISRRELIQALVAELNREEADPYMGPTLTEEQS